MTLAEDQKYDVSAQGSDLVLTLGEPKAAPAAAPAPAVADPNLVLSREDDQLVSNPAHKLGRIWVTERDGAALVQVAADGEIGRIGILELKNPARLALDLRGVSGRFDKASGALLVKGVRTGKTENGVRIVIDAGEHGALQDLSRRRRPARGGRKPKAGSRPAARAGAEGRAGGRGQDGGPQGVRSARSTCAR